ncbi:MAG: FAD-dependent oxidoreductase [Dehalococcoidia bacterium]|nr:FAD-dependent oxidoreductase [Dehalococcoidia bacterium]
MRVAVIGAGIIGASIAYNLARRPGVEVTVIEKERPGAGASSHSFAWTNAFDKEPLHYHTLNRDSMELWHRYAHGLGVADAFECRGRLQLENTAEGAEVLRARVRRLQSWGYRCRVMEIGEVSALEPGLVTDSFTAASYSAVEGHVDVPRVIEACLRLAQDRGAEVLTGRAVTGLQRSDNGKIDAVETTGGSVACDVVAVAGGTSTPELAAHAGVLIPQPESPGIVIRTDPRPPLLASVSVLHLPALGPDRADVHLRQTKDGVVQIGQGTQESLNEDDSQAHADDLLDRGARYFPALKGATALPQPVGYRPMPADGLPVLGFAKSARNLYIALMHSGVTLAPLVSELATLEIVDGAQVEALAPYRVERFS